MNSNLTKPPHKLLNQTINYNKTMQFQCYNSNIPFITCVHGKDPY